MELAGVLSTWRTIEGGTGNNVACKNKQTTSKKQSMTPENNSTLPKILAFLRNSRNSVWTPRGKIEHWNQHD